MPQLTLHLNLNVTGTIVIDFPDWILSSGLWNDNGVWDDEATWKDMP